jgi:hypothetical protein
MKERLEDAKILQPSISKEGGRITLKKDRKILRMCRGCKTAA